MLSFMIVLWLLQALWPGNQKKLWLFKAVYVNRMLLDFTYKMLNKKKICHTIYYKTQTMEFSIDLH